MAKETKAMSASNKAVMAEMLAVFEAYKSTNDARLDEIEAKGSADTLLTEKLNRLDKRIDDLSLKAAVPDAGQVETSIPANQDGWARYLRHGDESGVAQLDTKAFSASSDDQGGYAVPPELDRLIESRLLRSSPMRQIATVRQTSSNVYRKPVALGVGASWANETNLRNETATSGFSLIEIPAGELYALPAATQNFLDDTYADIDAWLADEVESSFSNQESLAFVTGNGTNRPKGFLDYSIVSDASQSWGQIGAIDGDFTQADPADQLIDLVHAPKVQFRANARFVMNRQTAAVVRKLKDADGRYLWAPGLSGEAATILGYPVTELEHMPDIAAGNSAIGFGDFQRGYLITDRQGARVLRDPYSNKPYVMFYTTKRVGGGVQNFDAIKLMKF